MPVFAGHGAATRTRICDIAQRSCVIAPVYEQITPQTVVRRAIPPYDVPTRPVCVSPTVQLQSPGGRGTVDAGRLHLCNNALPPGRRHSVRGEPGIRGGMQSGGIQSLDLSNAWDRCDEASHLWDTNPRIGNPHVVGHSPGLLPD